MNRGMKIEKAKKSDLYDSVTGQNPDPPEHVQ